MAAGSGERPITVYGAMAANLVIAVAKFVAAFFTGSSSMLSEGIHSVVDTGNQGLLLLGIKRSKKPPDHRHPFGYGQEIYFWALVVAMLLFSVGGGVSLYEGVVHIRNPEPIREPVWNYAVLGIAFLAEGASWVIAVRHMGKTRRPEESWFRTFQRSKDPAVFVVVAEDTAAMLRHRRGLSRGMAGGAARRAVDRRGGLGRHRRDPRRGGDPAHHRVACSDDGRERRRGDRALSASDRSS